MKIYNRTVCAACAAALAAFLFVNCDKRPENQAATAADVTSFRDIPGITEYEIKSITELQEKNLTLVYASTLSTGAFIDEDQAVLRSVIDKAFPMGAVVVVLLLLLIVSVFWIRNRSAGIRLEKLVRQRTAELEFEASKLAAIFDSSPDIIFCKDLNSRYIQCNKSYADTFNTRLEEIKGKGDEEIFSYTPETAQKFVADDRKVISSKHSAVIEESVKLKHLNNKILYFETIKAPLILNGEVIGIIGISRDISRRKEIEKELALQTVTLTTLVDSIPDFVFTKDTDLRFTQCNKTMVEYLGCRKEDIIGDTKITSLGISPEIAEKHDTLFRQVIETGEILLLEHPMPPYDDNSPIFETTHAPIIVNGVITGVLGVGRNITQRKAMEEEVLSASRSKTAFLANMSHEMRTPMNVVVGLTDLMLEETNLPENLRENLKKISTAGSTLLGLINDVLDISKIEAGKLELMPVRYDIPSLLNDIIILNMIRTEDKSISFKLDIDETLFSSLIGDDLRIKQIINNLLSNSFKYTQRGAITFGMRTEREGEDDVWIYVYVSDTGIGIRPEDMSKLFSTYNQVDTRVNRSIVGTGLGLSINKMLVEHMDGEITVESEYGKGTTFRFRIKQKFVNGNTIGAETAENLRSFRYADTKKNVQAKLVRPDLSYANVLVVDDMQTNLDVAVGLLRKYKMRVDCVNSGQDAIDAIAKGETKYDAIFMDHMMPEMDGVEAAHLIRGLNTEYARTIPIIALTANAIAGNEQMFFENDFQAFLAKPINIMNLDSIVQRWVRDKSREINTEV